MGTMNNAQIIQYAILFFEPKYRLAFVIQAPMATLQDKSFQLDYMNLLQTGVTLP
jgi:hypothetical protein